MKFAALLCFLIATLTLAGRTSGQVLTLPGQRQVGGELVTIRGILDQAVIAPGQTFNLAIIFEIKPKWHIYWRNPGAGAAAPEIDITAPQGFEVLETRWPRPQVLKSQTGDVYAYDDQAVLFVPIKAPPVLEEGRVRIEAAVSWAVCDDQVCKLGSGTCAATAQTVSASAPQPRSDARLDRYLQRFPKPIETAAQAGASFDGATLTVVAPAQGHDAARIISDLTPGVVFGEPQITIESDRVTARVPIEVQPQNSLGEKMVVAGLLMLGDRSEDPSFEFRIPVDESKSKVDGAR